MACSCSKNSAGTCDCMDTISVKHVPPMYDQAYVDMLKDEIEHWKKLARELAWKERRP